MKIHRITCLVIDPNNPNTPAQEYADMLENCKHVYPSILSVESAEIGEWHDEHPLNHGPARDAAIVAAFTPPVPTTAEERDARAKELRKQIRTLEAELDDLPAVFEPWEYFGCGFWFRDNRGDKNFGAEVERVGGQFHWSLSTGQSGRAPTPESAKEAADNAAKSQGVILK